MDVAYFFFNIYVYLSEKKVPNYSQKFLTVQKIDSKLFKN